VQNAHISLASTSFVLCGSMKKANGRERSLLVPLISGQTSSTFVLFDLQDSTPGALLGHVLYRPKSYLVRELDELWNPRPVVKEDHSVLTAPLARSPPPKRPPQPKRPPPWYVGMSSSFSKDISKIDRKLQGRILEALNEIIQNPVLLRGDTIKPLSGELDGCWRYRIGDFRLIYSPDKSTGDITLLAFESRGSAYSD
jgi:mRNA-degrading endonuclease RelE of RelBE toxin-antitoxin system